MCHFTACFCRESNIFLGCDACRARKVRCARENPEDQKQSCKHCITLGIPCTYDYQPKKRGPPNLCVIRKIPTHDTQSEEHSRYLRRLQEAAAAAANQQQPSDSQSDLDIASSPISTIASPSQSMVSPTIGSKSPPAFLEPQLNQHPSIPSVPIPPSRYPIAADTYHSHYSQQNASSSFSGPRSSEASSNGHSHIHSHGQSQAKVEEPPFSSSPSDSFNAYPLYNWSYKQHQLLPNPVPPSVPPLSYYYRPRRLEEIAPRDTISLIIALFFDFVYPLTPCVHKPSFMADLHARREERDPLFFALVMSTVASTLVQVPRSYLPMERPVVRKLAQVCGASLIRNLLLNIGPDCP